MKMTASKRVKYRSVWYQPGQEFDADTRDLKALRLLGAEPSADKPTAPEWADVPAPVSEPRRTYRRRDMRSED